jgi:hypothetical protein
LKNTFVARTTSSLRVYFLIARPVGVGGVPEGDSELDRLPEDRPGRLVVECPFVEAPRGVAEAHAAESDPADL